MHEWDPQHVGGKQRSTTPTWEDEGDGGGGAGRRRGEVDHAWTYWTHTYTHAPE